VGTSVGASVGAGTGVADGAGAVVAEGATATAARVGVASGADVLDGDSPSEPPHPATSNATARIGTSSLTMIVTGEEVSLLPCACSPVWVT
jgi:hypothetical protein